VKHGKGEYISTNGIKYIGGYVNGEKEGQGKVFTHDDKVAYDGQFVKGMPHGKGFAPNPDGEMVEREWINGIDKMLIGKQM
jgi:hypothetical protein